MPFSLLLMLYLLFAVITYNKLELIPLIICGIVGLICGYFDYSRYLTNRSFSIAVCILTIVLVAIIFTLDLNFAALLIVVTFTALGLGAIGSIISHSIYVFEKRYKQSENTNQSLVRSNDLLHVALSEGEEREAKLKAMMEQNVQSIWDLSDKNNQLSLQNTRLSMNLDNISSEKRSRENDLISLARSTSLMEEKFKEIIQSKQALEKKQERLIRREKELYREIEQQKNVKNTDRTDETISKLEFKLSSTQKELEKNQYQKSINAENLASAQKSLEAQASEKRELEDRLESILKEQEVLIDNTERLKAEKNTIQKELHTVQSEVSAQRSANLENKEIIKEQSLIISELRVNDDFLNKWLEIETLLIKYSYTSNASKSVDLINHYHCIGKIDRLLKDDLHEVRIKRNNKNHKINTKIYEHDVKKINECYIRLEKCLA